MVWGAIWVGGRSDLYIMDRDEALKKNDYSSKSYVDVLEDQLPTIWSLGWSSCRITPVYIQRK
jgi:hypothetical protein